jgi:hypothetical protein
VGAACPVVHTLAIGRPVASGAEVGGWRLVACGRCHGGASGPCAETLAALCPGRPPAGVTRWAVGAWEVAEAGAVRGGPGRPAIVSACRLLPSGVRRPCLEGRRFRRGQGLGSREKLETESEACPSHFRYGPLLTGLKAIRGKGATRPTTRAWALAVAHTIAALHVHSHSRKHNNVHLSFS